MLFLWFVCTLFLLDCIFCSYFCVRDAEHIAFCSQPPYKHTDRYAAVRWHNRCGTTIRAATDTPTTTGATTTTTAAARRCRRRSCRCRKPPRSGHAAGSPTCWCSPRAFSCVAGRRTWCASWAPNWVAATKATDGLRRYAHPS